MHEIIKEMLEMITSQQRAIECMLEMIDKQNDRIGLLERSTTSTFGRTSNNFNSMEWRDL